MKRAFKKSSTTMLMLINLTLVFCTNDLSKDNNQEFSDSANPSYVEIQSSINSENNPHFEPAIFEIKENILDNSNLSVDLNSEVDPFESKLESVLEELPDEKKITLLKGDVQKDSPSSEKTSYSLERQIMPSKLEKSSKRIKSPKEEKRKCNVI